MRSEVARSLENDPVALGLVGALALGSIAALAFSALGFVVTAQVSAAERASSSPCCAPSACPVGSFRAGCHSNSPSCWPSGCRPEPSWAS